MVTALIFGAILALIVAAKEDTPSDSQKRRLPVPGRS